MAKRFKQGIVVEAVMDRTGSIIVRPKSDKWALRFSKTVQENGGPKGLTAFFQEGSAAQEFIDYHVPKPYRTELNAGWMVRWIEDPWVVGHWYGWDAHTAAE